MSWKSNIAMGVSCLVATFMGEVLYYAQNPEKDPANKLKELEERIEILEARRAPKIVLPPPEDRTSTQDCLKENGGDGFGFCVPKAGL